MADLAADTALPVGVVRVLIADSTLQGAVTVVRQQPTDQRSEKNVLQDILDGLSRTPTTLGCPSGRDQRLGLANGFIDRPETGAVLEGSLVPGATVALVSGIPGGGGPATGGSPAARLSWRCPWAQSLWRAGAVDLVDRRTATTRASVLSGYATAAAVVGSQFSGNADAVTARFLGWLRDTDRPWLVVLDDLTAAVALDDGFPWPTGPACRVLVTTAEPGSLFGRGAHVVPVGPFSRRELLTYLIGRLTADLDQRQGAIDLVGDLDGEPLALAQASAAIASSELTCHDYREHFAYRRDQAGGVGASGGSPARARSPGRCRWTTPTCCHRAPLSRSWCSPRCSTATRSPARP